MITRVTSWIFQICHEKSHYRNGHVQENSENIEIRENPRINSSYHSCEFHSKMTFTA